MDAGRGSTAAAMIFLYADPRAKASEADAGVFQSCLLATDTLVKTKKIDISQRSTIALLRLRFSDPTMCFVRSLTRFTPSYVGWH